MLKRTLALALIALIAILPSLEATPVKATNLDTAETVICNATLKDKFSSNEVIIVVKPEYNFNVYGINNFSKIGCTGIEELFTTIDHGEICRIIKLDLSCNSKQDVLSVIKQLEKREDIYSAEPNYTLELFTTPNDTEYNANNQWAIDKISLPSAWNITTGSSDILVGVIDSGIDTSHPELSGRVNNILSKSFVSGTTSGTVDTSGHGTGVAGIIGAKTNNSIGIAGVAWNVQLVSLKVGTTGNTFNTNAVVEAINYATEKGIDVLNCSFGSYTESTAIKTAIQNFPGPVVCAAGNEGVETPMYPACSNCSNIISVGASTSSDTVAFYSNYGVTTVDLFAPGDAILTSYPKGLCGGASCDSLSHHATNYHEMDGTSASAPYVTGVVALMLSKHPNLTPQKIRQILIDTVDTVTNFWGTDVFGANCVSGGRLNAYAALQSPSNHTYTIQMHNSSQHKCTCVCGSIYYEPHCWNAIRTKCLVCGYNNDDLSVLSLQKLSSFEISIY